MPDPIGSDELLWCIIVPEERMIKWPGRAVFQGPIHGPAINVINLVLGFAGRSPVKSGHFYCPDTEPVTATVGTETWTVSTWPDLPLTREQLLNSWFGCRCPEKEFNLRLRSAPIRTDGGLGSWNLIPLGELLDTKTPSDRHAHEAPRVQRRAIRGGGSAFTSRMFREEWLPRRRSCGRGECTAASMRPDPSRETSPSITALCRCRPGEVANPMPGEILALAHTTRGSPLSETNRVARERTRVREKRLDTVPN